MLLRADEVSCSQIQNFSQAQEQSRWVARTRRLQEKAKREHHF